MLHPAVEAGLFYRKDGIRELRKVYTRIHADLCGESRVYRIRMLQDYIRVYTLV